MLKNRPDVHCLLLAGGAGLRLWPLSRESYPKQFCRVTNSGSLIQSTYKRLLDLFNKQKISIVTGKKHKFEVQRHLYKYNREIGSNIITEPNGRNTAPAVLLGTLKIIQKTADPIIFIFPSDHVIENIDKLGTAVKMATQLAENGYIATLGIKPKYPETGYGYIKAGKEINEHTLLVDSFVEKPSKTQARECIKNNNWFWNSGIFAFKASNIIEEYKKRHGEIVDKLSNIDLDKLTSEFYNGLPNISFDKAIMEHTKKTAVIPIFFSWNDLGSWKSVYDNSKKGNNGTVLEGNVVAKNSHNCLIKAKNKLIVTNGISNLAIIDTEDALLISDLNSSPDIKSIVSNMKKQGKDEVLKHNTVYSPWGYFTELYSDCGYRIRKIVINPGSGLSLKKRLHGLEHWIVSKGIAKVINDNNTAIIRKGESVFIPQSNAQRIENIDTEELHITEVQFGEKLEDDDIIILEDNYGRSKQ